jgi:hypothetical protein
MFNIWEIHTNQLKLKQFIPFIHKKIYSIGNNPVNYRYQQVCTSKKQKNDLSGI